jgi:esterase/lipase
VGQTEYVLLYLHGFSATQHEGDSVRYWIANRLQANAYYPRIAGHGLEEEDSVRYATFTATAAWEKAKKDFALATILGKKVIIMSCSTGTPLALKLAATYPEKVYALVNYSPNIRLNDPLAALVNDPWGLELLKWSSSQAFRDLSPREDGIVEDCKHRSYCWESVIQMQWLLETTMIESTFKAVRAPSLTMMWNESDEVRDRVVSVEKAQWMHENLGSSVKQWTNCACKDHVIQNYQTSKAVEHVLETTHTFLMQLAEDGI